MKKQGIQISLKPGERIFINGAVMRSDRKVTLELLNDVTFLLESHVLQPADATTPLRQLYFIGQTMLMDPANADSTREMFQGTHRLLMAAFENETILGGLKSAGDFVAAGKIFDALKAIRGLYPVEEDVLAGHTHAENKGNERREVA
jgi:flagellar biosynthesis repressor protein FlbT